MSNSGYIKTNESLLDRINILPSLMKEINDKYFGSKLDIYLHPKFDYFKIKHPDIEDYVEIYNSISRCLTIPWPDHPYMSYICIVFKQAIATRLNAHISDESDPESSSKPNLNKYYPIQNYINIRFDIIKNQEIKDNCINEFKNLIPKGMENY